MFLQPSLFFFSPDRFSTTAAMSDFVESEAEESEEEYDEDGAVVPRATKKFVEEEDGECALPLFSGLWVFSHKAPWHPSNSLP